MTMITHANFTFHPSGGLAGLVLGALVLCFSAPAGLAQDTRRAQATRAELEASLKELDQYIASSGYSGRLRDAKRREADLIRSRLSDGDLQVGDSLDLTVVGEKEYTGKYSIGAGRMLALPGIPDIPLQGVLRSEAQDYLSKELAKYVRNPQVRVRTMIRLSVFGSVGKPGFYQVPADELATDAIMVAGGPVPDADPARAFVRRAGVEIWPREAFQDAIRRGLTLDQLNLRAGDEVVLDPRKRPGGPNVFTIIGGVTGLLGSVYFFTRF